MTDMTIKLKDFLGKKSDFKKLISEFGIAAKDKYGYIIENDKNNFIVRSVEGRFHTVVLETEDNTNFRFVMVNDYGKNPDFIFPQHVTHVQSLYE